MNTAPLPATDIPDMRSWAMARYIARHIAEVERRRREQQAALSVALEALGEDVEAG